MMKIGFIGLGAMGQPMALNLWRAGHQLRLYDLRRQVIPELTGGSASWADSPAQAAEGADVVLTCLPGPAEVEAVALHDDGLLNAMTKGATWFDLTTNSPELMRSLHDKFALREIEVLDAPVSGGPKGAQSRQLALWVGGNKKIFDKFLTLLLEIGDQPAYIGAIGSGCIVKLVHNSASFAVQSLLAEGFTMGVKAGVEPAVLFEALRQGTTGRSRTFDRLAEQFLPGVYDPASFALRLAYKDMNLALALANACDVPMRMIEIATKDMAEAMDRGWGERDARVALTLQEERASVSVKRSSKTNVES
jgi:3-hydroxyisobutyrate dehydrogenase